MSLQSSCRGLIPPHKLGFCILRYRNLYSLSSTMEWQKALNNAHLLVQFPHSYMNLKLLRSVYVIVLISLHKMVIPPIKWWFPPIKGITNPLTPLFHCPLFCRKSGRMTWLSLPRSTRKLTRTQNFRWIETIPLNHGYEPHKLGYKLAGTWCKKNVNNWDTSFSDFQTKLYVVRWKSWVFVVSLSQNLCLCCL